MKIAERHFIEEVKTLSQFYSLRHSANRRRSIMYRVFRSRLLHIFLLLVLVNQVSPMNIKIGKKSISRFHILHDYIQLQSHLGELLE